MNCSYSCDEQPNEIQPYGDIAGIGVVVGFVANAYLVVAVLVVYYLFIYDPTLDPFRPEGDRGAKAEQPNPVDVLIIDGLKRIGLRDLPWARLGRPKGGTLEHTFNKCVLALADVQIIIGVGILVSGYASLHCGLSAYHWQLVVYLAWFASLTHLSALTFLRNYLHNHRAQFWWRAASMVVLLVLLCGAVGPTGHFSYSEIIYQAGGVNIISPVKSSHYAMCYYKAGMLTQTTAFQSMLLFIFLIVYGYSVRVAKMSPWVGNKLRGQTVEAGKKLQRNFKAWKDSGSRVRWASPLLPILFATHAILIVHVDIYTSVYGEVFWLVVSLVWGTRRLADTRLHGPGDENSWTFGQILPVLLLAAPLVSVFEYVVGTPKSDTSPQHHPEARQYSQSSSSDDHLGDLPSVPEDSLVSSSATSDRIIPITSATSEERSPREESYKDLPFFPGTLLLAVLTLLEVGVYILIIDPKGIFQALGYLFTASGYQLSLQISWPVFAAWISKAEFPKHLRRPTFGALCTVLVALSVAGVGPFLFDVNSNQLLLDSAFGIAAVLSAIIFVCVWASYWTGVFGTSPPGRGRLWKSAGVSYGVSLAPYLTLAVVLTSVIDVYFLLGSMAIFAGWLVLEHRSHSGKIILLRTVLPMAWVRTLTCLGVMSLLLVQTFLFGTPTCMAVLHAVPLFFFGGFLWACLTAVQERRTVAQLDP